MVDKIKVELTEDGSVTLYSERVKEHYHSIHGAVQESYHVFIKAGLHYILSNRQSVNILEVGFGTGLNALLTLREACRFLTHDDNFGANENSRELSGQSTSKNELSISYTALEPYPIEESLVDELNYIGFLSVPDMQNSFSLMHRSSDDALLQLGANFQFRKLNKRLEEYKSDKPLFDLVYFDAFSPVVEPNLWTIEVFHHLYNIMSMQSALVTYCSKGIVRRMMQECGFKVERLPGPPGKHEMIRALKSAY